jgi:2-polyprenyl-3-methyl-5-hydroxy-6-metoxy-1,4-benzoquinol methylase
MARHERDLAAAFDGQAERFEKAPVQSDPQSLERLVRFAGLNRGSRLLDAGCGPGLVSSAFLAGGCRVVGVDLSAEMVARASTRCQECGDRARFHQVSVFDPILETLGPFDAIVSRLVLHHVLDPRAFLARQVDLLEPGGVLVLCDHATDPDPVLADRHNRIERLRDTTHTNNLTSGRIVDLFASVGLADVTAVEERFCLDFDEWFDRGTPAASKAEVRAQILEQSSGRGFSCKEMVGGSIRIECVWTTVRGLKV